MAGAAEGVVDACVDVYAFSAAEGDGVAVRGDAQGGYWWDGFGEEEGGMQGFGGGVVEPAGLGGLVYMWGG